MTNLVAAFREALAEARPYLLSHHVPGEYNRCYTLATPGREVHVCARCAGVYPGIAAGLAAYVGWMPLPQHVLLVAVLPLPALVDWRLTVGDRRGANPVRTATGALLGYAYGLGLPWLLFGGNVAVLAIGIAYAAATAGLLARHHPR